MGKGWKNPENQEFIQYRQLSHLALKHLDRNGTNGCMVDNDRLIKVIAFDPGITTGHASGVIEDGRLGVVSGQSKWNEIQLYLQLEFSHPDIIVYERFEYRSQKAYNVDNAELFPRNLIGVLNLYIQKREADDDPLTEWHTQMPAQVLGKQCYWTNDKLKAARVYKVANEHANDAMRHLLYWWQFGPGFKYNTNGFEPLA